MFDLKLIFFSIFISMLFHLLLIYNFDILKKNNEIYVVNLSEFQEFKLVQPNIKPQSLVEKKISLPAYDQCLKASHVFNVLDARGAISVAQRAEYIGRIREITKSVAAIWINT